VLKPLSRTFTVTVPTLSPACRRRPDTPLGHGQERPLDTSGSAVSCRTCARARPTSRRQDHRPDPHRHGRDRPATRRAAEPARPPDEPRTRSRSSRRRSPQRRRGRPSTPHRRESAAGPERRFLPGGRRQAIGLAQVTADLGDGLVAATPTDAVGSARGESRGDLPRGGPAVTVVRARPGDVEEPRRSRSAGRPV
jgi:hypothetical protein